MDGIYGSRERKPEVRRYVRLRIRSSLILGALFPCMAIPVLDILEQSPLTRRSHHVGFR